MTERKPRLNLFERAIAVVSPEWAVRRATYREYLRSYEAGEINRFNDDWTPINADTENTDKVQRDLIKARARYLENNSDIAGAAVGGIVRNVVIEHEVYGNLEGTLNLHSRRDVQQYVKRMHDSHAEMLSAISGGIHTHLVEAATEEELEAIGQALRDLGVLYKN